MSARYGTLCEVEASTCIFPYVQPRKTVASLALSTTLRMHAIGLHVMFVIKAQHAINDTMNGVAKQIQSGNSVSLPTVSLSKKYVDWSLLKRKKRHFILVIA